MRPLERLCVCVVQLLPLCSKGQVHSERTSWRVARELLGKFGEMLASPGSRQERRESLTPSRRHAKIVSKYTMGYKRKSFGHFTFAIR